MSSIYKRSILRTLLCVLMAVPMAFAASAQTLPAMIANPENGSSQQWMNGTAVRWGTSRLTMVNAKGFSVTYNGRNVTSDFVMFLNEYDPDENTSLEDVQLQIENRDPFPLMDPGTVTFTVNAGVVNVNVNGTQVPNPAFTLTYKITGFGQSAQVPDPTVNPANNSTLSGLGNVTLSWPGYAVQRISNGYGSYAKNITYTVNGGATKTVNMEYVGSEDPLFSDYYSSVALPINATTGGNYVITIPAGTFQIANEDKGTLQVDKDIILNYTVNISAPPATTGNELLLEDKDFFPQPNVAYSFKPATDGTLRLEPLFGGYGTRTTIMGGLYSANGILLSPSKTDGDISGDYIFDLTYLEYEAKGGTEYFFKWTKNVDEDEYSLYATYTGDVTGTPEPDPDPEPEPGEDDGELQLEDTSFFPKADVKYYFTPATDGELTLKPMEGGNYTKTAIMGGLYTAAGELLNPTTDGSVMSEGFIMDLSYLSYNLKGGSSYYFQWSKNSEEDDYALYATYTGESIGTPEPEPGSYMTGAEIDPANRSSVDNIGNVTIAWTQYRLAINPPANQDFVYLPLDGVKVTLNGVDKTNGTRIRAINTQGSNEGSGGSDTFSVGELLISFDDMAFFWSGTLNVQLPEGLVKSTTGEISPAFNLTYFLGGKDVKSPAIFSPTEGAAFPQGEAVVYVSWSGYQVTAINGGVAVNTINEEGDVSESTNLSNDKLSIDNGKLKIDLNSLPVGRYQMWVSQGAVDLGNDAINADSPYSFSIFGEDEPEPDPEPGDNDGVLKLQDVNFFPKADVKYYFNPTTDGELTLKPMEGGNYTTTSIMGGLYTAAGELLNPTTDGSISGEFVFDLTYLAYELKGGNEYYFQWGKNSEEDEYALYATYTGQSAVIPEATDIVPTVTMADGQISISWDGCPIELTEDFSLSLVDNTTGENVEIPASAISVDDNNNLVIDLGELAMSDGNYTVVLGKGSVNIDEDGTTTYNKELTYEFKTSGVSAFENEGYWRVYDLNGANVLNTEKASDLQKLEKGKLYIVNGRKVMVNK